MEKSFRVFEDSEKQQSLSCQLRPPTMLNMQVLRRCSNLHRAYSTQPPLPELAKIARTASTPIAVRLRRRKKLGATAVGDTDATEDGLTPTEQARFTRLNAQGLLEGPSSRSPTAKEWMDNVNARRSRIRGTRSTTISDGIEETQVVGRKVYLPNIVFRLVRNQTQPGQPYNPYEATFRIPQSVTKTDIRSLLLAVYGVKTTYIRTDNYISAWHRTLSGYERKPHKTYKRAVVGLVEPFYYPGRLEDLPEWERKEREDEIEKAFSIKHTHQLQKEELLRMTIGQGRFSFKLKEYSPTKKNRIARDVAISTFAQGIRSLREEGKHVTYKTVREKVLGPSENPEEVASHS